MHGLPQSLLLLRPQAVLALRAAGLGRQCAGNYGGYRILALPCRPALR